MVKVGDKIPNVDLDESSPGDKVNLSKELTGKGLIIGVPAAFSEFTSQVLILAFSASGPSEINNCLGRRLIYVLQVLLVLQATSPAILAATSSTMLAKFLLSLSTMLSCEF